MLLRRVVLAAAVHRAGDERRQIPVDVVVQLLLARGALVALVAAATALAHALARHAPATVATAARPAMHAAAALLLVAVAAAVALLLGLPSVARIAIALGLAALIVAGTRLGRATRWISLIAHMSSLFRCPSARQAGLLEGVTRGRVSAVSIATVLRCLRASPIPVGAAVPRGGGDDGDGILPDFRLYLQACRAISSSASKP